MTLCSEVPTIDIALDKERVKQMGQEEKLNILVDIAFRNHQLLQSQAHILYGEDGETGICETVRTTRKMILVLWTIFCGTAGVYLTILLMHIGVNK